MKTLMMKLMENPIDRDEYGNYIPADPSKGPMMVK